jgi:hypothetical protein
MSRILRRRPSPAMAVAFIALCVALAGTASALPGRNQVKRDDIARNAVRSNDITRNAIRNRHIKARQVTRSKIARRSINSLLVGTDALVGSNILESSLAKVPDADKLDGKDSADFASVTRVDRFTLTNGQTREVLKGGPFTLTARCTISGAGDAAEILIATTQDNAAFVAAVTNEDLDVADLEATRRFVYTATAAGAPGFSRVAEGFALAPDGTVLGGASLYAGVNVLGHAGQCVFGGRATA